ncbi:MAG: zf-HC2 domain-containing protein, partial [Acidobacteria bacterium]|nr:zf-HC2 domain-containing protein [Acidobacteriota bacterium]
MISFFYKRLFRLSWHPSHEELLQYLDGQMSARTEAAIKTHLKGCWSCRLQQEKVERLISDFMEERNSSVPNFSPEALPRFESRLDGLDSEARNPLLFARLFESLAPGVFLPRLSLRFTLGFITSLFILFFLIRLSTVPPVSAKEILQNTEKAVAERIRQVPEPVIYQQLQVHSYYSGSAPQDFVTWETWTDGKGHRLRQRVKDASGPRFVPLKTNHPKSLTHSNSPLTKGARGLSSRDAEASSLPSVLAELEQVLQVNRIDLQRPLSPAAYETWRSSIQPRSEEVIESKLSGGDKALTIKTNLAEPFAPNSIVEAEFIVRVEDWHPLMQRF